MKKSSFLAVTLALASACLFASASYAAPNVSIIAVGSSGIFPSAAIAAVSGDPVRGTAAGVCGSNFWTGSASGIDPRGGAIPAEGGTIWVAYDNAAAPTVVCAYLSVDSIVGQRLFFGQGAGGNGVLQVPASACGAVGANKVAFMLDWNSTAAANTALPFAVWNALTGGNATAQDATCSTNTVSPLPGSHFTVAFTDVRAEDAQYTGNNRVLAPDTFATAFFPPDDKGGMGYGPATLGVAVTSSFSTASSQSVGYSFTGNDPISNLAIPASNDVSVGALAMMIFVNNTNNAAGSNGFGDLILHQGLTNINSHTLSALYTGQNFFTRDVIGTPGLGSAVVHLLNREPQSGTYTTFEWQVIRQRDGFNANSQESGLLGPTQAGYISTSAGTCPAGFPAASVVALSAIGSCSNPVNFCIGSTCGLRGRVIGTGQMVSIANAGAGAGTDALGYAFWSLGTFGGKSNITYLTLDGADPLFKTGYTEHNGAFPGVPAGQGTIINPAAPAVNQCSGYFNSAAIAGSTAFSCNGYAPTFAGVQKGYYRSFNFNHAYYFGAAQTPNFTAAGLNVVGFIRAAQDQAAPVGAGAKIPDFLPTAYCANAACSSLSAPVTVFRSHYASNGGAFPPSNGLTGAAESGGDVGGAIFLVQDELDTFTVLGNNFWTWVQ